MTTEPTRDGLGEVPSLGGRVGDGFCTTRWTRVGRAKAGSEEGRRALTELCEAYYEPVAAFLRCELRDADLAREVAHDFFAAMLEGGTIARAEEGRGRFRSYLLGAVKHFLGHRRESMQRLKRGGGVVNISLQEEMEDGEVIEVKDESLRTPDAAYDRQWALTVLGRAMEALQRECELEGRGRFFEEVKPWLTGEAAYGDQTTLAMRCGMNANALKVAVHRLKRRFREHLKAEVRGTLEDEAIVEDEMRVLFEALGA